MHRLYCLLWEGELTLTLTLALTLLKVCDFGLAHLKLGSGVNTARHGSPSWTAPEVLKGEARDEKAGGPNP